MEEERTWNYPDGNISKITYEGMLKGSQHNQEALPEILII